MRSPLAEARNESSAPRQGEIVAGRYRVEGVIGSGGMGRVVAARDQAGHAVAIKLLLSPPSERVYVERFFREARAVSRINSAHVVKVLAVSSPNESTPFIVMERLRGRDFGKRLRAEGPLTLREVADCIIQAADALAHSHAVGVVHRDVKPSNLFDHANADGTHTIKVLDFGISKARGPDEFEHTLTTSRDGMLGSPPYMSPEHIRDARTVDHRTDIWSLGVVAYQLLAGRLPFDGQSVGEVFCSVLERRFSPLSSVRPDVPREIEAIIGRCLSREPGDRYQTAADLARAFIPYASASSAALVDAMPTAIPPPAAASGASLINRGSSPGNNIARIDSEVHTLTLPPEGSIGIGEELQVASERFVTMPTLQGQSRAPLAMLDLGATLQPLSEPLSAASVEAAKRMKIASRRSMFLAIGVGVALLALAAIPLAVSREAKPTADVRESPIVPATATTTVATATGEPGAPPVPTTTLTVANPTAPQGDDITILTADHRVPSAGASSRAQVRPSPRPQKTPTPKAKEPSTTHAPTTPAAERVETPPPAPPPPPPAPAPKPDTRPELHPNPYGSF